MRALIVMMLVMSFFANACAEEPGEIVLWPNGAPGALGTEPKDIPSLMPYVPAENKANGATIVICPGGGYGKLSSHEGKDYALFLAQHGFTCFVLKYRLGTDGYRHPAMLADGARAIRLVRSQADRLKIDPNRIGIMGTSAGGHLAATLLTHFDAGSDNAEDPIDRASSRPDFGILCYAVISMDDAITHAGSKMNLLGENPSAELVRSLSNELQVTPQTPPCFVWHGADDKSVPVAHALRFADALAANKVPFELHIYESARHGIGLGDKPPFENVLPWAHELVRWLRAWSTPR